MGASSLAARRSQPSSLAVSRLTVNAEDGGMKILNDHTQSRPIPMAYG